MPSYGEQIDSGRRLVMEYATSVAPAGLDLEWGPMDNAGRYVLRLRTKGPAAPLLRLSKADLARCAGADEAWEDVRAAIRASVSGLSPVARR